MKRHPNFKGGRVIQNGYFMLFVGVKHRLADVRGYAYEHRIVAEKKLGRELRPGEQVHHKDENRLNNDPENLEVKSSIAEHRHTHAKRPTKAPGETNPLIYCLCGCGKRFLKYDSVNRPRKYISGHNKLKTWEK